MDNLATGNCVNASPDDAGGDPEDSKFYNLSFLRPEFGEFRTFVSTPGSHFIELTRSFEDEEFRTPSSNSGLLVICLATPVPRLENSNGVQNQHDSELAEFGNLTLGSAADVDEHANSEVNTSSTLDKLESDFDGLKISICEFQPEKIKISNNSGSDDCELSVSIPKLKLDFSECSSSTPKISQPTPSKFVEFIAAPNIEECESSSYDPISDFTQNTTFLPIPTLANFKASNPIPTIPSMDASTFSHSKSARDCEVDQSSISIAISPESKNLQFSSLGRNEQESGSTSQTPNIPVKRNYFKRRPRPKPRKILATTEPPKVPFFSQWKELAILGLKAEVPLTDPGLEDTSPRKPYWFATILQFAGYKAQVRYEGYQDNSSADKWLNFCVDLRPSGYSTTNIRKVALMPPLNVPYPATDWAEHLVRVLTGGRTIRQYHDEIFQEDLECSIKVGSNYEVLDKTWVARMRLAKVNKVVGRRVHVSYWNSDTDSPTDKGFWCHENSTAIAPQGWCKTVGHLVNAPDNYDPPAVSLTKIEERLERAEWTPTTIVVGMRLEAVDPLNLSQICAATCGFCKAHGIKLQTPSDFKSSHSTNSKFDWETYLKDTKAQPLLIDRQPYSDHGFEVGMKLEAVDVMTPSLIGPATVVHVIGRLLRIHFDGWGEEYDQWADAKSVDLFPIGWCEAVGYQLDHPPETF